MTAITTTPDAPVFVNVAHMLVPLEGMHSPGCAKAVDRALNKLPGVTASTSYAGGVLALRFDRNQCPLPTIVMRLDGLGYRPRFDRAKLTDVAAEWESAESGAGAKSWAGNWMWTS